MTNGNDRDDPPEIPVPDFPFWPVAKATTLGVGAYVAVKTLTGNPAIARLKSQQDKLVNMLGQVYDDPDQFSDGQLQATIDHSKNIIQAKNHELPGGEKVDISRWESELQGQPLDTKAATWLSQAERAVKLRLKGETSDPALIQHIQEAAPKWLKNHWELIASAGSAAAIIAVVNRIIDFGRGGGGGGGLSLLRDMTRAVREGIFGDPNNPNQVESPAQQGEQVSLTDPSGTFGIQGSIRAAAQAVGLNTETVVRMLNPLGLAADEVLALSATAVDLLLEVTSLTRQQIRSDPYWQAAAFVLAFAAAAAVILSVADGALPVGEAVGILLFLGVANAVGVDVNRERIGELGQQARQDLGV